jgi:hypothetical protein
MPESTKPQIQTPPPNSPGKDKADEVYKQEFGGAKTEGEQAVEFLDSERQDVAQSTSKNQEEDLKKSLGTGFTFGALNVTNSTAPEAYLNRAEDYLSSDSWSNTARKFTSNQLTVPGSPTRRFVKPLAIGSAAMYAGSRGVDKLLEKDRLKETSKQNVSNVDANSKPTVETSMKKNARIKWMDDFASWVKGSDEAASASAGGDNVSQHLDEATYDGQPHPNDPYFDEAVDRASSESYGQPSLDDIEIKRQEIEAEKADRSFTERLSDGAEKSKDEVANTAETAGGIAGAGLLGGAGYYGYNAFTDEGKKSRPEQVAQTAVHRPASRAGRQIGGATPQRRATQPQMQPAKRPARTQQR